VIDWKFVVEEMQKVVVQVTAIVHVEEIGWKN
jgi:hypothetical protein